MTCIRGALNCLLNSCVCRKNECAWWRFLFCLSLHIILNLYLYSISKAAYFWFEAISVGIHLSTQNTTAPTKTKESHNYFITCVFVNRLLFVVVVFFSKIRRIISKSLWIIETFVEVFIIYVSYFDIRIPEKHTQRTTHNVQRTHAECVQ